MDRDPTPAQPDPSDPLGIDLEARLGEIVKAAAREAAAARRDVEARRSAAAAEAERYLEEARLSIDAEAAGRARRLARLGIEIDALSRAVERPLEELARAVRGAAGELGAGLAAPPRPPWEAGAATGRPGAGAAQPTPEPEPAPKPEPEPAPGPPAEPGAALPVPAPATGTEPQPESQPEPSRRSAPSPRAPEPAPAAGPGAARLLAIEMAVGGATRAEVSERLRERFGLESPGELLDGVFGPDTEGSSRLRWGSP